MQRVDLGEDVADLAQPGGKITAIIRPNRKGADMFAAGILIMGFAATTIIGATWLALTASGDPLQ
jgi:hypothetical protein